jgi:Lrp/AsnC family leucine-responsive transcriptional regulator
MLSVSLVYFSFGFIDRLISCKESVWERKNRRYGQICAFISSTRQNIRENSRMSYSKLAKVANLSPNATAERVHRLQKQGVIQGFSVDISPASLGLHLQAFVDVKLQPGTCMETFEKAPRNIPGIREAASITGSFDARLWVDCEDANQLGKLIEQLRRQTKILETSSTVVCRELKIRSTDL